MGESPRWLIVKGRRKEAAKCIKKASKVNGKKICNDNDEELIFILERWQNVKQCPNCKLTRLKIFHLTE